MVKVVSPFIYSGPIIHSLSLDKLQTFNNGAIVVSGKKIVHFSENAVLKDLQKQYGVADENVHIMKKGQFLIPGFIDTHIHAPQYPNNGLGYDMELLQWLEVYTFPLEKKYADEEFAQRVYDTVVKRLLQNGTTTATYFATIHPKGSVILAKSALKFGQRAFIGKVNMVINSPPDYCESFDQSLTATRTCINEILNLKSELITPIITPRFAVTCDMKLMKELAKIANEFKIPIQTHVSENTAEVELVRQLYPDCRDYVDVYDKAGLVTEKTILAHGIYLSREEITTLKDRKCTISHCPNSNVLLQSGLCRTRELLKSGVNVSLGTDCSGGCSVSMLDAIRLAMMSSIQAQFNKLGERLSYGEAFYMATLAGAQGMELLTIVVFKCLGIADRTGNFMVGKDFDAVLVDMENNSATDLLLDYSINELFQKFLYLGDDRMIAKVFVAGAQVI
ncbi:UNVERIFIED_CONTAM: hypothetical protein PYX00_007912 [Menopon gallinae]|uniref:Guanine deaminase n=1 Tax=Menopon gallinae TaxID=328185 RepID=A0AAW2HL44_9NEOP